MERDSWVSLREQPNIESFQDSQTVSLALELLFGSSTEEGPMVWGVGLEAFKEREIEQRIEKMVINKAFIWGSNIERFKEPL